MPEPTCAACGSLAVHPVSFPVLWCSEHGHPVRGPRTDYHEQIPRCPDPRCGRDLAPVEVVIRKVRRADFRALAQWTQHAAACERVGSTAGSCTCGLDEAWRTLEAEL